MKLRSLILLTLAVGSIHLLNGCAFFKRSPKPEATSTPQAFVQEEPAPGKALIYFYRAKDDSWPERSPKISMGDRSGVFEAKFHHYKKIDLAPGEYEVQTAGFDLGNSALKTKFESGKTYFLQYSAKVGRQSGRHLYFISSDEAQKEIQGFEKME